MRRITISILGLSLIALPVALDAQQRQQRGMNRGMQHGAAEMMMPVRLAERILSFRTDLGLSPSQVAQINRIHAQFEQQKRPLAEDLRAAMSQHREELQQQRAAMRERMAQMTIEQRAAMRAAMRERMQADVRERRPTAGRGTIMERMPEDARSEMEQMREMHRATNEQILDVLTVEQRTLLRALRPEQPVRRGPARGQ